MLEQQLRAALREEVRSLSFNASSARVARRYEQRMREKRTKRIGFALVASVAVVAIGAFVFLRAYQAPQPAATPTVAPPTVAPPTVAPPIALAPNQTLGSFAVALEQDDKTLATARMQLVCSWSDSATISVYDLPTWVELAGRTVSPELSYGDVLTFRLDAGDYVLLEGSADIFAAGQGNRHDGTISLTMQSVGTGTPEGDFAAATTFRLTWACGTAPANPATPALAEIPKLTVTTASGKLGEQSVEVQSVPPSSITINGQTLAANLATGSNPVWPSPGAALPIEAVRGSGIGLALPSGWTITTYRVDMADAAGDGTLDGFISGEGGNSVDEPVRHRLGLEGDWLYRVTLAATGPDGGQLNGRYTFRLHVDPPSDSPVP